MNPALVLCSHGTSDPAGREVVRRLAATVRRAAAPFEVQEAVVDVEEHRLPDVLATLRRPAVVVPLLLSGGFHVHHDIAEAVAARPHAVAAEPLGPSWTLAEIGARRLHEAGAHRHDTVVLGASGSSDARAMAQVEDAADRLAQVWGRQVRVGHVGRTGTPLAEVVADAREGGRRVVVSSYLLAPGYFQTQLATAGADVVTGPLLAASADAALVSLVLRRFDRAARSLVWASASAFTR